LARWRRNLVALALAPAAIALLSGATQAVVTGTVTVTKTDANTGAFVRGTTFVVHQGDPTGPVVATPPPTNDKGVTQAALAVGMKYCLEERAVPPGYLKLPTFKPDACFTLTALNPAADVRVTDPPAPGPSPTPTPTPTPTPSPSPTATGELRVVKTDLSGTHVTTPGFTFNVSLGTTSGQVVATVSTDGSGTAVAAALTPGVYCVEEIATPDGFQLAPTFSPSACVSVAADPTQGHSPSTITVADPPTATPSSTPGTGASKEPPLGATGSLGSSGHSGPGSMGTLAKVLLALGALLLVVGGAVIAIEVRRRRQTAALQLPPDTW